MAKPYSARRLVDDTDTNEYGDDQDYDYSELEDDDPLFSDGDGIADMRRLTAMNLHNVLTRARDLARRDYGPLTGRHTDLLEFERSIEGMLSYLDSLIGILKGT